MKYDDASWHYGGDFPADLPEESGGTHIGMYVAWALLSGLGGALHVEEAPEALARLAAREVTPGEFLFEMCDGKFTDEDLDDEGNRFTAFYFDIETGQYLADYEATLADELLDVVDGSFYYVTDSWAVFDKLQPVLDGRLVAWRSGEGRPTA